MEAKKWQDILRTSQKTAATVTSGRSRLAVLIEVSLDAITNQNRKQIPANVTGVPMDMLPLALAGVQKSCFALSDFQGSVNENEPGLLLRRPSRAVFFLPDTQDAVHR